MGWARFRRHSTVCPRCGDDFDDGCTRHRPSTDIDQRRISGFPSRFRGLRRFIVYRPRPQWRQRSAVDPGRRVEALPKGRARLASLGETDCAAGLLQAASEDRCGMLAMVLQDPAHSHWLPAHRTGRRILRSVFGSASAGQ